MKLAIGNDHAGTLYKQEITAHLIEIGIEVENFGTDDSLSVDYPDFVHPVARAVSDEKVDFGIVVCGSGNGVSMTVNKYVAIRGALCWTKEIAYLARTHNDANILCIPARFTSTHQAIEMVDVFLNTEFEGGRHLNRVNKIACQ
ncbi:MAG: ribose 5-phosphate isomerase B [Flavobacteriaceae bacterium]|nr:ribose 5-phosphate isomerase B [Flavobacteriaceae bacterium]